MWRQIIEWTKDPLIMVHFGEPEAAGGGGWRKPLCKWLLWLGTWVTQWRGGKKLDGQPVIRCHLSFINPNWNKVHKIGGSRLKVREVLCKKSCCKSWPHFEDMIYRIAHTDILLELRLIFKMDTLANSFKDERETRTVQKYVFSKKVNNRIIICSYF